MDEHEKPSFWRWLKRYEDWFAKPLNFAAAGLVISSVVWVTRQVLEKLKDNSS